VVLDVVVVAVEVVAVATVVVSAFQSSAGTAQIFQPFLTVLVSDFQSKAPPEWPTAGPFVPWKALVPAALLSHSQSLFASVSKSTDKSLPMSPVHTSLLP